MQSNQNSQEQELLLNQIKEQLELYKINASLHKGFDRTKFNNLVLEAVKIKGINIAAIFNINNLTEDEKNYFFRCILEDFACIGNTEITKQSLELIKINFPEKFDNIINSALSRVIYDGNTFTVFNTIDLLLAAGADPCYKLANNESIIEHAIIEQGRLGPMAIGSLLMTAAKKTPDFIINLLKTEQYSSDRKILNFLWTKSCDSSLRRKIIAIIEDKFKKDKLKGERDLKHVLKLLQDKEKNYQLELDARIKIGAQAVLLPKNYAEQFLDILNGSTDKKTTDTLFWQAYNQPTVEDRKKIFDELLLTAANIKDTNLRQEAFTSLVLWAGDNHTIANNIDSKQEAFNFILLSATNLPNIDKRKRALGEIILAVSRITNNSAHEMFREIIGRYQNNELAKVGSNTNKENSKIIAERGTSATRIFKAILPSLAMTATLALIATVAVMALPIALGITISLVAAGIAAFSFIKATRNIIPRKRDAMIVTRGNKILTPHSVSLNSNKSSEQLENKSQKRHELIASPVKNIPKKTDVISKDAKKFKI